MSKSPKKPGQSPKKPGKSPKEPRNSPAQQKSSFRSELTARLEAEHEAVQFERGIMYEDIELALGVGDVKAYFKQVESNFLNAKNNAVPGKSEKQEPKPKIKIVSSFKPRRARRKQKGKINK